MVTLAAATVLGDGAEELALVEVSAFVEVASTFEARELGLLLHERLVEPVQGDHAFLCGRCGWIELQFDRNGRLDRRDGVGPKLGEVLQVDRQGRWTEGVVDLKGRPQDLEGEDRGFTRTDSLMRFLRAETPSCIRGFRRDLRHHRPSCGIRE